MQAKLNMYCQNAIAHGKNYVILIKNEFDNKEIFELVLADILSDELDLSNSYLKLFFSDRLFSQIQKNEISRKENVKCYLDELVLNAKKSCINIGRQSLNFVSCGISDCVFYNSNGLVKLFDGTILLASDVEKYVLDYPKFEFLDGSIYCKD